MIRSFAGTSILFLLCVAVAANAQTPLGTGFTYQGRLSGPSGTVDGTADFQLSLWDLPGSGCPAVGGNQVGTTQLISAATISDGLFTIAVNSAGEFGSGAFDGDTRWLEIAVRSPSGTGAFTTLCPREAVTAAPYALYAASAPPGHSLDAADGSPVDALFVDAGGKVGIGTITPSQKFAVYGGNLVLQTSDNALQQSLLFQNSGSNYTWRIYRRDAGNSTADLRIAGGVDGNHTQLPDIMTFTNAGNVGIGTTAPETKLDVNGTARMTGFRLGSSATAGQVLTTDASGVGTWQPLASPPSYWQSNSSDIHYDAGRVGIGSSSPSGVLDVFADIDTGNEVLDQQQTLMSGRHGAINVWQSFIAGSSGVLTRIDLHLAISTPVAGTLRIYAGEGTSGQQLVTQAITFDGPMDTFRSFYPTEPPVVDAGQQYTVWFAPNSGAGALGTWVNFNPTNAYPGGRSSFSTSADILFRTYVAPTTSSSVFRVGESGLTSMAGLRLGTAATPGSVLTADENGIATWQDAVVVQETSGNVGIGTAQPNAKLDVAGTVKAAALQIPTNAGAGKLLVSDADGHASWQALPSTSGSRVPSDFAEFATPGTFTWTVPEGVTAIVVQVWGGGGGGGGTANSDGCSGSGGAGGYARAYIEVVPGEQYDVVVGAAGAISGNGGPSSLREGVIQLVFAGGGAAGTATSGGAGGASDPSADVHRNGGDGLGSHLNGWPVGGCTAGFAGSSSDGVVPLISATQAVIRFNGSLLELSLSGLSRIGRGNGGSGISQDGTGNWPAAPGSAGLVVIFW